MREYFAENKARIADADNFFDYYEGNGWMVGKTKMKKWRASANRWIRKDREFLHISNRYNGQQHNKLGFILCGRLGNGKSTLLLAFQRVVSALAARNMFPTDSMDNCPRQPRVRIIDAREVAEATSTMEDLNALANEPFLVIDDMGTEAAQTMNYGNAYRPMSDLLEKRYARYLPTGIATNLTPPEIRERYGDRVADRFNETMEVIAFTAPSHRSASGGN